MAILVVLFGLLVLALGLWGVARPERLIASVLGMQPRGRLVLAIGLRVLMGVVFLMAAPACRFPTAIAALGGLALFAAAVLAILGPKRLESMVQWWFQRPPAFIRSWCLAAVAFGVFLVYAGS